MYRMDPSDAVIIILQLFQVIRHNIITGNDSKNITAPSVFCPNG